MKVSRALTALLLAIFLCGAGAAAPAVGASEDPQKFIQGLAQKAITTVAAQNVSDGERSQRFRHLFVSAFDIPEIGKFVLGRHWRAASPAQQSQFLKEFEDMQVFTWSRRFKDYHGEHLQTLGARKENEGWLVDSQIVRPQGSPIPVQWRVRQESDGALRIVDIVPEGVSMALTQRQDFAGALQSNGGNVDALLASMRAKNQQLAATQ